MSIIAILPHQSANAIMVPVDFAYTGAVQPWTVPADGVYKLEVWGAQGLSDGASGGGGGYASGEVYLESGTQLYIYVGGQGSGVNGGFNGGGRGYNSCGAGGATDIRITDDSLYARVIVAGGAAGGFYNGMVNSTGGSGGGVNGGSASISGTVTYGYGGTQTAGGGASNGSGSGSFGQGMDQIIGRCGGGGGWYGGGCGSGGGGGSGWVYTETAYNNWAANSVEGQSGQWLLDSDYYLSNTSMSNSVRTGNGAAKISRMMLASSVLPSTGDIAGGETVTITGEGFSTATLSSVTFGGTAGTCNVVDDTTITCTTPAYAVGTVNVVVTFSGLSAITLTNAYTYEDTPPIFITMMVDNDTLNLNGTPNQLIADFITVNTITNNPTGYNLTIETADTDLVCEDDSAFVIPAISGTGVLNNTWGYGVGTTAPTYWTGVTTSPVEIKNFGTDTDLTLGDDTQVWFGARVDYSVAACKYIGTVTFTAIANGSI